MTIDKVIEQLQNLKKDGGGSAEVGICDGKGGLLLIKRISYYADCESVILDPEVALG